WAPSSRVLQRCSRWDGRTLTRIRLIVLDQELRNAVGGLRDIQAPQSELAALAWAPRTTLFVENLACAYCLPDLESTVAVVGLGRAISLAAALPWIHRTRILYWGDLDTHGLEILSLARASFPGTRSVLMDSLTLQRYRSRWVPEAAPNRQADRSLLLSGERELYEALLANAWPGWKGEQGVRLEQERLDWSHVDEELRRVARES
ncbi:Wadjet anti-phage system protein JetD domain-containing protein, partial [Pelomonas aquatica]